MEMLLNICKCLLCIIYVTQICVTEDTSCIINNYDFGPLNKDSPWMVVKSHKDDTVTTVTKYNISLCSSINKGPCKDKNVAVCREGDDKSSTVVGLYTNQPNASDVLEVKKELIIRYEGEVCNGSDHYRSIIDLKCGKTLGSPVFLDDYNCDTYFEWQTSCMCKTPNNAKEVKCYLYDKDNKKRDLAGLVGTSQNVITDSGEIIQLAVCRSLSKDNPAGALLSGKSIGDVTTPLQLNTDGNLFIKYETSDSTTTVTFKCPERGYGKPPVWLSSLGNQYEIEWETEHACPEEQLQSSTCVLTSDENGVDVDLTPLKKGSYYTVEHSEYKYKLSVCEKLKDVQCPDDNSTNNYPTMSICQERLDDPTNARVLGQAGSQRLRYADDVLTLRYKGGEVCHHNSFQRETIITFVCGSEEGTPKYVDEDDCTYQFEWHTKYACIHGHKDDQCTVTDNAGHLYDLSILSRIKSDTSTWEVLKANPEEDTSSYWLNLCGPVQNMDNMHCPLDAGICRRDDIGYKNLGKEKSRHFNSNTKTITVMYSDGESCSDKGDKTYSATLTLHCRIGDLDSAPVLISTSSDGCDLELEWETAAACVADKAVGSGCKVYDPVLGNSFDLNPLKKDEMHYYTVESNDKTHEYFINVCNNVNPAKCNSKANAGVCQHEEAGGGNSYVTGLSSDVLTYSSGHLKLLYSNGDAYRGEEHNLRQTEIIFLCDLSKDPGMPEFAIEADHTYTFKWYTKYACAAVPIECSVQSGKEEYDLSSLSTSSKTWLAVHTDDADPSVKYEYFIGVCGPLLASGTSPAVSCRTETAVCGIKRTTSQESITYPDLGHATTGPEYVETNHLKLTYTNGGNCTGGNQSYSSEVHLHCERGSFDTNPEYVGQEDCVFMFTWKTEAACNLKKVSGTTQNCSLYDPISDYVFNFKPLSVHGGYAVQSYDKSKHFQVNVCDVVNADVCPNQEGDTQPAVCSTRQILGTVDRISLSYAHEDLLLLKYTTSDGYSSEIQFSCNPLAPPHSDLSVPKYISTVGDKSYVFEFQTSLACAPQPVDCVLADLQGNEYDLTSLAREDDNWAVEDRFKNTIKYFINVCKPIVRNDKVKTCPGGPLGGCQVTEQVAFNVGYVQSKPTVSENGTISIQYHNGDLCHKGKENESYRSMVIFFTCHQTEQGPEFREETPECQYIIDWKTPSACPARAATGLGCKVTDPEYGAVFDLNPLKRTDHEGYKIDGKTPTGENYTFVLNVCDALPTDVTDVPDVCTKAKHVASCQKGKDFVKDAGKASSQLMFEDGVLVLEYQDGTPCHDKTYNRSTRIEFHCHYGKLGKEGPTYIKESEECKYHFDWETSLACFNLGSYPDCRLTDDEGNEYDLGMLNLPNDNYEVIPPLNPSVKFYINVCGPVVNKKGMHCPPNSASCLSKTSTGKTVTHTSIGDIAQKVLTKEGSGLVIEYHGGPCPGVANKNSKTTILFQCPDDVRGEVNTSPQYLFSEDDCQFHFTWTTRAACPLGKPGSTDKTGTVTGSGCKVTNPQTGHVFDMSGLGSSDRKGYTIEDKFGEHQYIVDVCKAPSGSLCTEKTGVCQRDASDPTKHWDAGQANGQLLYNDGSLYLNYTGGASCHSDKFVRNTIITFVCRPGWEENTAPEFVTESEDCTYYIDWHTDQACETQFRCQLTTDDAMIDLSPLVKTTGQYTVLSDLETSGMSVSYHINPCHALNPISGTRCPPGAGVCRVGANNQPMSLGRPAGPPVLDATNQVVLHYVNGSRCQNGKKRNSAKIRFGCLKGAEIGVPKLVFVDKDKCEYNFEWMTDVVCLRQEEKTTNCVYYDNSTNQSFDIGKLGAEGVIEVPSSGNEMFYIHVCDKVSSVAGCNKDAVCKVTNGQAESFGVAGSTVDFIPEGENIKMKYTGSTACGTGKKRAYIIFECDRGMTGSGRPELFGAEAECTVVFKWKTPVVCPNLIMNCITSRKGSTFDLRMLSRPEDSWILAGSEGDVFHINLCQSVHDYAKCPKDAAVCRTSGDSNQVDVLGTLQSQQITTRGTTKDPEIMVRYTGGSAGVCPRKKRASVEIYLQCGQTLGRPVFMVLHETECIFEFMWSTNAACVETRYPVKPTDGILTEPISQTQISLEEIQGSSVFYDTLDGKSNHYKINLLTSSLGPECLPDSVICKHTSTNSIVSLGNRNTAQFFFQGSTLEATYTTDTVCDTNPKKKVSSMIEFECVAASYHIMTGPMYEYKTPDCEYVFVWYTPKMCFQIGVRSSQTAEQKHKTAGFIVMGVVSSLLLILVIALYLKSPDRRHRCGTRIRTLFRRQRDVGSYSYSVLSNGERGESSSSLLSNQEDTNYGTRKGDLPSFQDDSDDDIIL